MPDLKNLLGQLSDEPMPDRWGDIQRRPLTPLPDPKRGSRAAAYAVSFGIVALVALLIVRLAPLGADTDEAGPGNLQPPAWLVDIAYRSAYMNGDLTPTSAEWVLTDARYTDAPSPAGGTASAQEYLVVLHGDFTAYAAKVPTGASLPTGSVATLAVTADPPHDVTDWGVGDQAVDVPGLQPFTLPDPSQTYTDAAGWTVPVPPDWSQQPVELRSANDVALQGAMFANHDGLTVAGPPDAQPQASGIDLPKDGVALTIATTVPDWGGHPVPQPPLSTHDLMQGSALAGAPTLSSMWFLGPDGQWYTLSLKVGPQASPIDTAAADAMIEALTFTPTGSEASPTPTSAVLPTADAVVDGRFVTSVQLDDGALRVDPAPGRVPAFNPEEVIAASPVFQGKEHGVLGYGLITLTDPQHGIDAVTSVPGWVAFAWGGTYSCPAMTAAPSIPDLPSDGYVAVAFPDTVRQPFSYHAASSPCGGPVVGPTVEPATHVVSVAWEALGPVTDGSVDITYVPTPCGGNVRYQWGGGPSGTTITVTDEVPDAVASCPSPAPVTFTIGSPDQPVAEPLRHADVGPVRLLPR